METMLGWHFADATETLRYGDGRKIIVGEIHKVDCNPVLCEVGLHASPHVLQALQYAPSAILFRVELSGVIVHDHDKSCATERRYIARIDAESILREFARKCALQVIHLWDCPRIVREYLETGDENKRVAAGVAAKTAAKTAAMADAAAGAAAGAAAWAAAGVAAVVAAEVAAEVAAGAAAKAAAAADLTEMLDGMVKAAMGNGE